MKPTVWVVAAVLYDEQRQVLGLLGQVVAACAAAKVPLAKTLKTSSASSAGRVNQDFRDVCEKNVLTSGRSAVLPHCGHAAVAFSCSLIERVMLTSRRQFSQ